MESPLGYRYFLNEDLFYINIWEHKFSPVHKHNFLEFVYVLEGRSEHIVNGETTILKEGDYFIIDYDKKHAFFSRGEDTIKVINCLFYPRFIDSMMKDCRKLSEILSNYLIKFNHAVFSRIPTETIFHDDDGSVKKQFLKMLNEYQEKKVGYKEMLRCILIETILMILRNVCLSEKISDFDSVTGEVVKFVEKNYMNNILLSDICEQIGYSVPYVSKSFKDNMNMTFSSYLQKVRINNACRLLANTNNKIEEIAHIVGYSDTKFFNSIFKKVLGSTPREYRNKIKY
ncbi:MAG: helix-turn-helix domain-containing protein [Ruminococcaceae bacterium]|nr:helix-turn-helix domain-containing protein [Oscillospiraceae bacterium]